MIKPTIGRKVWWWQHGENNAQQPEDATVVYVHSDRCVNLHVIDHNGNARPVTSAHLVQPGDGEEGASHAKPVACYATWMPFQVGQARAQS